MRGLTAFDGAASDMSPQALEELIRSRIPVADFMQLRVVSLAPAQVEISAPLEPNRNVHGTLFGGSGTAIALVAAWSLVHARMNAQGLSQPLVVAQQSTQYFKPVTGPVMARAAFASPQAWESFTERLAQGRRGRVAVVVELFQHEGETAARVEALFAA